MYQSQIHRMNWMVTDYVRFYSLCVCIFSIVLLISCSHTTEDSAGSLSGNVVLLNDTTDLARDTVDFSGVPVAINNHAMFDTTVTNVNIQYPQIEVPISQET